MADGAASANGSDRSAPPGRELPGGRPWFGFGLGLRSEHFESVLAERPTVGWFEIISENFLVDGGKPRHYLDAIRANYPLAMHGVSLSIGSAEPLDRDYLRALDRLARHVEPIWVSDHLCWTGIAGINGHDLFPLPYDRATLDHVAARVGQVQDALGRELVLENVSSYARFAGDTLDEAQFLAELVRRTGCKLLLDVNNVYVSSRNHGFDADAWIATLPADAIWQIHLAGHSDRGDVVIDTHDAPVCEAVWALYARTLARIGAVTTMIERDDHIPPLGELVEELGRAREIADSVVVGRGTEAA